MRPPYIRPTEAPTQLDWPELLDLAARLDTKVYRLDDHGRMAQVTEPPSTTTNRRSNDDHP
jgi:hypothetical protein